METDACTGVPNFGTVICRERLLRVFLGQQPALTLISAPAGCGKSVLAAQLAEAGGFDDVLWVPVLDEDIAGGGLLVSALISAARALSKDPCFNIQVNDSTRLNRADALLAISEVLRGSRSHGICLVLDGFRRLTDLECLQDLALLLRALAASHSLLIVTCRSVGDRMPLNPAHTWTVEEEDLRFTPDEVLQLATTLTGIRGRDTCPEHLVDRYKGHAALTSLVLRHGGLEEQGHPPRDLMWYLDRLVGELSAQAMEYLYAAALLGEDTWAITAECQSERTSALVWDELASLSPLLVLCPGLEQGCRRFIMHAALRDSIRRLGPSRLSSETMQRVRDRVLAQLAAIHGFARMQAVLQAEGSEREIAEWCELCGDAFLRYAGPDAATRLLSAVSASRLSGSPRLLLLRARILREQERYEEASASASLGASLAEAVGDQITWTKAVMLLARLGIDSAKWGLLTEVLSRMESAGRVSLDEDSRRLLEVYAALAESRDGRLRFAIERAERVLPSVGAIEDMGSDDAVFTVNGLASVEGAYAGRWSVAARLLTALATRKDIPPSQRLLVRANLAVCQLELGSLLEARALLDEVIDDALTSGLKYLAVHSYGTRSSVHYAMGDAEQGRRDYDVCEAMLIELGQHDVRVAEHIHAAMNRRASGQGQDALALVEEAQLIVQDGMGGYLMPAHVVQLEAAASLLALGDFWAAKKIVAEAIISPDVLAIDGYAMRADLLQAEIGRIETGFGEDTTPLRRHCQYISTGSANRLVALYVRAFPGLLGIVCRAIGAENIPLRMLLMIPSETVELGLKMAQDYLGEDEARILRQRRGPSASDVDAGDSPIPSTCYVRLFGGLEVTTPAGVVDEETWRKRKARLLFVILLLRQHQDVPRDVLLERLWPDMDEERARRNFYVTWSTMKRALACGASPSVAKSFVQCSGGVCRVTRQVRSDLDDFDEALAVLRRSVAENDFPLITKSAHRLIEIYRGELLPGDLYEEWLSETRERAKHDFCDAMMLAANCAELHQEFEEALAFLKKASAADPWREDVYQVTMRCQMNSGQRSRAIETYLNCRSRLTEDLGIDPSTETTRLYQAVLSMEDGLAMDQQR